MAAAVSISAQQSAPATSKTITTTIDAGKPGEPISKYDYGMFIEHIGPLINHGLWAELLDDRKFYSPVTSVEPTPPAQPPRFLRGSKPRRWVPVGPDASVTMDTNHPYVGEHSPKIALEGQTPHGILQSDLPLRKGIGYVGRIALAGTPGAKIQIALVWGDGDNDRQIVTIPTLKSDYAKYPFKFTAGADTHAGRLEVVGRGTGFFHIGAVSLMPADNVEGFRPDTTSLLRELDSGMWRLPGGNYISGTYDWRNTVGDLDKRPPTFDFVRPSVQPNDVGIDELMILCRLLKVDPYISLNSGFGDARSAAELVEYVNGSVHTAMGALRARNGHPEPYHVKYWNIGNEMYGYWQFGHTALKYYTIKHNDFAEAMRKVDPSIVILASGASIDEMTITCNALLVTGKVQAEFGSPADWTGGLLAHSLSHLDAITEHWYAKDGMRFDPSLVEHKDIFNTSFNNQDVFAKVDEPLVDELRRPSNRVRLKAESWETYKKTYPDMVNRKIFMAIDEWANSTGNRGTNLKIALSYALVMQEMFRYTDFIKMSAYTFGTSTLDYNDTDAIYNTTGLMFKIYRDHFGTIPVAVSGNTPQPAPKFPVGGDQPQVNAGSPNFPLDVSAALTSDHKYLTVAVVNPTESAQNLTLDIQGVHVSDDTTLWRLTGPNVDSKNVLGTKPEVSIASLPISGVPSSVEVAPLSINIYRIPVE